MSIYITPKSRNRTLPAFRKLHQILFPVITSHSPKETSTWIFVLVFYFYIANGSNLTDISTNLWSHSICVRTVDIVSWIHSFLQPGCRIGVGLGCDLIWRLKALFHVVIGLKSLFSGCRLDISLTYRPLLDLCTMIPSTGSSQNGHLLHYGQQENFSTFKSIVMA